MILVGFCVSFFKLLSKLLGKPVIPEKKTETTKLTRYKAVVTNK
jgi:hypothetical protein